MLRLPNDEAEKRAAITKLSNAREMMVRALSLLDDTPVITDCDAHLDCAIHSLDNAIARVEAGAAVFDEDVKRRLQIDESGSE